MPKHTETPTAANALAAPLPPADPAGRQGRRVTCWLAWLEVARRRLASAHRRHLHPRRSPASAFKRGRISKKRGRIAAASLVTVIAATLFLAAAPALAYSPRTLEYRLSTGEFGPTRLAIDSADDVWVNDDFHENLLSKFNPFGERLSTPQVLLGTARIETPMAADHSNNDLYVPDFYRNVTYVVSSDGTLVEELFGGAYDLAVDNSARPSAGRLYESAGSSVELLDEHFSPLPFEETASYIDGNRLTGTPSGPFTGTGSLAVGPQGEIYVVDSGKVDEFQSSGKFTAEITAAGVPGEFNPADIAVDPTTEDLLVVSGNAVLPQTGKSTVLSGEDVIDEFSSSGAYLGELTGAETPAGSFGLLESIAVNSRGYLYLVDNHGFASPLDAVYVFSPSAILPKVTYPGVSAAVETSPTESSATLNAHLDPDGGGKIETCRFEYVDNEHYDPSAPNPFSAGHAVPCAQPLPYTSSTEVSATVSGLTPGTTYHYRVLAGNANGTTEALPQTFDLRAPSLEGVSSSDLTETTADLNAKIDPQGADTTYYFEYGITSGYGSTAPVSAPSIGSFGVAQSVTTHLTNLQPGVTYHFRLVAENLYGKTVSEDQTFDFLPPSCPNSQIRQLTRSSYLPDCRAYELVSPVDTGGGFLYPEGPNSPQATDPARLAFGEVFGSIPGAGSPPISTGDLYVATRTDQGWDTRYVGIPGDEALLVDGPPGDQPDFASGYPANTRSNTSMDEFLDWNDGTDGIDGYPEQAPSYTPHVWAAGGEPLGTWPTTPVSGESKLFNYSPDFSHFFFKNSSEKIEDNNTLTNKTTPISTNAAGHQISVTGLPSSESDGSAVPGSSPDGSRVLMSASGVLYMRINDLTTVELSENQISHQSAKVTYVGMNKAATRVYFTSEERLTEEDKDTSTDLYMWSEAGEKAGHPLTLISQGDNEGKAGEPGNSDECSASWTAKCGVLTFTDKPRFEETTVDSGNPMVGSGISDNAVASENGDIYFYSPEQLDGDRGTPNEHNLYVYREGRVQYVTTLTTDRFCSTLSQFSGCSPGPVVRIQVTPSDGKMAFLTADPVTSYNSAGHTEMYSYDPSTEAIKCVSCIPDGEPPQTDVMASSDGIFMTDDGRIFFSTGDALVPRDTDGIRDVYEFVEGRPQLISSGTAAKENSPTVLETEEIAGLVGVSSDGTNVYFSTYDSLVPQDTNGSSLKFYDARTDGGFPFIAPAPPCEAAEECHGPGSAPPVVQPNTSAAELGSGGNLAPSSAGTAHRHKKKVHRHKVRRGRRQPRNAHSTHGGEK